MPEQWWNSSKIWLVKKDREGETSDVMIDDINEWIFQPKLKLTQRCHVGMMFNCKDNPITVKQLPKAMKAYLD